MSTPRTCSDEVLTSAASESGWELIAEIEIDIPPQILADEAILRSGLSNPDSKGRVKKFWKQTAAHYKTLYDLGDRTFILRPTHERT